MLMKLLLKFLTSVLPLVKISALSSSIMSLFDRELLLVNKGFTASQIFILLRIPLSVISDKYLRIHFLLKEIHLCFLLFIKTLIIFRSIFLGSCF